jgi:bacteriocin-like protein
VVELSQEDLQQIIGGYQQEPNDTTKIKKSKPKPTPPPTSTPTSTPNPWPHFTFPNLFGLWH